MMDRRSYNPRPQPPIPWFTIIALALIAAAVVMLLATHALGQTTTLRDGSGNVVGHARVDSNKVTTFTDRANRVTGSARTDANGVTRFYDAAGRVTGSTRPRQ